jgi:hypothetical protein
MVGLFISARLRSMPASLRASARLASTPGAGGAAHPVEVGAGREALAAPGQHHHAHGVVGVEAWQAAVSSAMSAR